MQKKGAELIKNKIKTFSHRPGVYRMLDEEGTVLYVGKAKDLIKRLDNYTHIDRLSERIRQMVSHVVDVVVIETAGETEAFLLEIELIKQLKARGIEMIAPTIVPRKAIQTVSSIR